MTQLYSLQQRFAKTEPLKRQNPILATGECVSVGVELPSKSANQSVESVESARVRAPVR